MKVYRRIKMKVDNYAVGDQFTVKLKGFGKFTATVQKVNNDGSALCFFDDLVATMPMNRNGENAGGFYQSDLCEWMNTELIRAFPTKILKKIIPESGHMLRIPTRGEVFGKDEYSDDYEEEEIKRLPLMKKRRNRICTTLDDEYSWYWLFNRDVAGAAFFAIVNGNGFAGNYGASCSIGVRPAFTIHNL